MSRSTNAANLQAQQLSQAQAGIKNLSTDVNLIKADVTKIRSDIGRFGKVYATVQSLDEYRRQAGDMFQPKGNYAVVSQLAPYITTTTADARYQPKGSYAVVSQLAPFMTTATADAKFQARGSYATTSDLNNYAKRSDLGGYQPVGSYATTTELSNYAMKNDLSAFQLKGDYALNKNLTSFATKSELSAFQPKADYAMKNDLAAFQLKGDYAMKNDLVAFQPKGDYAMKSEIPNSTTFATKSELAAFQARGEYALNQNLSNFASKSELSAFQPRGDYAMKSEIPNATTFATKTEIAAFQPRGDYALKTEIPNVTAFAAKSELSAFQPRGDYMLRTDSGTFATKDDLKRYREIGAPYDLTLGGGIANDPRGNSGSSRALVKDAGSVLAVNFGNDFTGGVRVDSRMNVNGEFNVRGNTVIQGGLTVGGQQVALKSDVVSGGGVSIPGPAGPQGLPGIQGLKGDRGEIGPQGIPGSNVLGDKPLLLRGATDNNHGLQWNASADGPRLWGNAGGQLGTVNGRTAASWNSNGRFNVNTEFCIDNDCITKADIQDLKALRTQAVRQNNNEIKVGSWNISDRGGNRLRFMRDGSNRPVTVHSDGSIYTAHPKDYNEGNYNDAWYREARVDF